MNKLSLGGRYIYTFLIGAAVSVAPMLSFAQIEEVVVTANKREQNLQDVGISVTALDKEALDRAGINDISRIELVTPGVSYGFIGSDAKISIRGANSNNTFSDNTSIAGFFADGVYRPRASQQTQAFFDVERVEILKGPQGTLYGRNTFAGAVNLYTNSPDTEAFDYGFKADYGRFEKFRTEGYVNVPLSPDLAFRFAGMSETSDGWIKNTDGDDLGIDDDLNFRFSGLWDVNENLSFLLRYTSISEEGTTPGIFAAEGVCRPVVSATDPRTDAYGQATDCNNPAPGSAGVDSRFDDPWRVNYDVRNTRDNSEDNITLEGNLNLGQFDLKYIGSYTDFESEFAFDGDFSANPGYPYYWDEGTESYTNELQLNFDNGNRIQATAGLYYSVDDIEFGFSQFRTQTNSGTALIDPFGRGSFSDFADFQEIETTTLGAYFQGEFAVIDPLRLIAGVRYNDEEKDTKTFGGAGSRVPAPTATNPDATVPDPDFFPFGLGGNRPRDVFTYTLRPERSAVRDFSDVTYRGGLEYDVSQDMLLYFSVSTGFLSGGVNADGTPFESQESLAYELGIKSRWLNNSLQLNAAIYLNEFTNLTTQELVEGPPGVFITRTVNGGEVDTLGFELEALWYPNDQAYISAALSLIDNEFGEFFVANPFQTARGVPTTGTTSDNINLDGETPPWSPDITLSLIGGYDYSLGEYGTITPLVQFYYSDEYNTDDVVTYSTQLQDSYTKTDFRLIWRSVDEQWQVSAFIENIEDEAVLARTNVGGNDLIQSSYLYPQNYGLNMQYNF